MDSVTKTLDERNVEKVACEKPLVSRGTSVQEIMTKNKRTRNLHKGRKNERKVRGESK